MAASTSLIVSDVDAQKYSKVSKQQELDVQGEDVIKSACDGVFQVLQLVNLKAVLSTYT